MPPTPQYRWPLLEQRAGCTVWVKHENHTPIGSFKLRGALVAVDRLRRAQPAVQGIIAATRGNYGQSIAYAARAAGLSATVVVPHGNSREKNAAMRAFGARLVEHGSDFDEALRTRQEPGRERWAAPDAVVQPGLGAGDRHLRGGAVPRRARPGCGIRPDRPRFGDLRCNGGA